VTFDWDDVWPGHDAMEYLTQLRDLRPDFRCTLYAVPGRCTVEWCESLPGWVELAVHGWRHDSNYECLHWTAQDMRRCLDSPLVVSYFVRGFKAPGWQISDACYDVLLERGWWVADQHLTDDRRPAGLRTYYYDGNWHGHVDNVCDNGIQETWEEVVGLVERATEFRTCGEAVG
jgi:hypothetical protein